MSTSTMIAEAKNICFSFGEKKIYDGLDISIPKGKITVIMGASGCGKSTLLSLLGGRYTPNSGQIIFDNEALPKKGSAQLFEMRQKMGMLFQHSALLTDLSVFDNVAFPLREKTNLTDSLIRTIVLMKLEMVGLRGTKDMMPHELSGGMARRVALARAIALDPDMIMYDEPFVGLDPISMGVIVRLIRQLNDALGVSSVVVTHDVKEGLEIADYVCFLAQGKVAVEGTPEEIMNSNDSLLRQFINGLADGPIGYHYPAKGFAEDLAG